MKLFLSALLIAVLSFAPGFAHAAENIVGTVLEVEGSATITEPSGNISDAAVGSNVHPQDVITTGPASRLYIQFIDNTEFTLSENAQFAVEEYNFNEKDKSKNYATYSVLKGAFLYVSGLVAKRDDPDVKVIIPQGSIGIRGTKFWGGTVDGEYGVIVGEGKVTVRNKAGAATLIKGQGTTLKDRVTKPSAPKKWTPAKIAKATATVALTNPGVIGGRMLEARAKQEALRAEHLSIQTSVKREDPVKLEERVEEKAILLNPEMRPDLLEEKAKAEAEAKAAADAAAKASTTETETEKDLRERLEEERLDSGAKADPSAAPTTTKTVTERVLSPGAVGTVDTTVKAGTETTTTTIRETSDLATETGTRALTTTTETTTTVLDKATGTVESTTEEVKSVTETPAAGTTTESAPKSLIQRIEPTVTGTVEAVKKPVTNTLNGLLNNKTE